MPTVYEHVRYGQVDDRVEPTPGDYEDTRIGLAVLEALEAAERHELSGEYWRVAGGPDPADLPHAHGGPSPDPSTEDAPEGNSGPSTEDPAGLATEPDIDVPAQPANPEE